MNAAHERWRRYLGPWHQLEEREFLSLYKHHWRKLETEKQAHWLEEIRQMSPDFERSAEPPPQVVPPENRGLSAPLMPIQTLMAKALDQFRLDENSDRRVPVPMPFRASCRAYETATYWVGKMNGMNGVEVLAEIPETEIAVFAGIEMAGGVLGLEQSAGIHVGRQ